MNLSAGWLLNLLPCRSWGASVDWPHSQPHKLPVEQETGSWRYWPEEESCEPGERNVEESNGEGRRCVTHEKNSVFGCEKPGSKSSWARQPPARSLPGGDASNACREQMWHAEKMCKLVELSACHKKWVWCYRCGWAIAGGSYQEESVFRAPKNHVSLDTPQVLHVFVFKHLFYYWYCLLIYMYCRFSST